MRGKINTITREAMADAAAAAVEKKCAWCNNNDSNIKLVEGKRYCFACDKNKYKECNNCHLPYPDQKYFNTEDSEKCQSCERKLDKQKQKRKRHELSQSDNEEDTPNQSNNNNNDDDDDDAENNLGGENNEAFTLLPDGEEKTSNPLINIVNEAKSKKKKKLSKDSIVETKKKELDEILDNKKVPKKSTKKNVKSNKKENIDSTLPEVSPPTSKVKGVNSEGNAPNTIDTNRSEAHNFICQLAGNNTCSYVEYFKVKYA